ncbi:hypothetical protein [uncultured Vagococcus sp.]|uniref:hypothetical protein n=1 Tax=uncultured Vagococcus sp. TaxID=189676 RepID=UPI0028D77D6C|nr:hypothetical protein [uncultured Vagococcus sp.]
MRFIRKLELDKDFFAPRYFAKHTKKFRRLSAEKKIIESVSYNLWSFSSPKIPIGAALIPASKADHMLLFSLEKTEVLSTVPFRLERYLNVNNITVGKLTPNQALYVSFEEIDSQYRNR